MSGKRRGRVSFADDAFASSTSLTSLPEVERPGSATPIHASLNDLAHNPHNPREHYTGEALDELAASLSEIGQLQPITVVTRDVFLAHYPDSADALGAARWVVVMGNRRLAAARSAGLHQLTIAVQDHLGGADSRLTEATLIENIHREALPPLLEAKELQGLVERHGSQSAVAQRVAKTQGWVSQRLALLKLAPVMQERLRSGEMTVREARRVASEAEDQQEGVLAQLRADPQTGERPGPSTPRKTRHTKKSTESPSLDEIAADLRQRLSVNDRAKLAALITR